ncbi:MAG: hypothetical protein JF887_12245 [Candidatus Dormibacteraeota bacterium]|uniref:Uncharacterized protein n=1 Tax=Candidatus Amunia macphersoniae TaxID=3127014 RepID=A0A934KF79_9BACT|nr:hypothetical protein [Candidatus Dormibacteraeota bacterium]
MRANAVVLVALGSAALGNVVGCGSPATSGGTVASQSPVPPTASPPSAVDRLKQLVATNLRSPEFRPGAATTACGQPDKTQCMTDEQSGDNAIAMFLAGEKTITVSANVADIDQLLHQHLSQWTAIADSLLSNYANAVQRSNLSYSLDAANAQIQGDLSDLANLP